MAFLQKTLQTQTLQFLPVAAISLPLNKLANKTGIKIAPSRCAKSFINNYISATANGPPERGKAPNIGPYCRTGKASFKGFDYVEE